MQKGECIAKNGQQSHIDHSHLAAINDVKIVEKMVPETDGTSIATATENQDIENVISNIIDRSEHKKYTTLVRRLRLSDIRDQIPFK